MFGNKAIFIRASKTVSQATELLDMLKKQLEVFNETIESTPDAEKAIFGDVKNAFDAFFDKNSQGKIEHLFSCGVMTQAMELIELPLHHFIEKQNEKGTLKALELLAICETNADPDDVLKKAARHQSQDNNILKQLLGHFDCNNATLKRFAQKSCYINNIAAQQQLQSALERNNALFHTKLLTNIQEQNQFQVQALLNSARSQHLQYIAEDTVAEAINCHQPNSSILRAVLNDRDYSQEERTAILDYAIATGREAAAQEIMAIYGAHQFTNTLPNVGQISRAA